MHLHRAVCVSQNAAVGAHFDPDAVHLHGHIPEIFPKRNLPCLTTALTHDPRSFSLQAVAITTGSLRMFWKARQTNSFVRCSICRLKTRTPAPNHHPTCPPPFPPGQFTPRSRPPHSLASAGLLRHTDAMAAIHASLYRVFNPS